eukprot:485023_1
MKMSKKRTLSDKTESVNKKQKLECQSFDAILQYIHDNISNKYRNRQNLSHAKFITLQSKLNHTFRDLVSYREENYFESNIHPYCTWLEIPNDLQTMWCSYFVGGIFGKNPDEYYSHDNTIFFTNDRLIEEHNRIIYEEEIQWDNFGYFPYFNKQNFVFANFISIGFEGEYDYIFVDCTMKESTLTSALMGTDLCIDRDIIRVLIEMLLPPLPMRNSHGSVWTYSYPHPRFSFISTTFEGYMRKQKHKMENDLSSYTTPDVLTDVFCSVNLK